MNTIKITTAQNIELEYDLAGLGERILAYLIDLLINGAYVVLFLIFFNLFNSIYMDRNTWIYLAFFLPVFFYDLLSEIFMNGQSIGKRVMKIKVISIEGGQASVGQYMLRWLFRLVDFLITFCMCALISVAVSERKQRVGDMVAGTAMIRTEPKTTFQQTLYAPVQPLNYIVTFPQVSNLVETDMQLIKEVIIMYQTSGNLLVPVKAAEKIRHTLNIETQMDPITFLKVLLSDYNYLTATEGNY